MRYPIPSFPKWSGFSFFYVINRKHTLREWQPPKAIADKEFNLCVVASFGYFIPPHVISCFQHGGINMHPSLLPKYRGAAPIQHALMNVALLLPDDM